MTSPQTSLQSKRGLEIWAALSFCWAGVGLSLWLRFSLFGRPGAWAPGVATCLMILVVATGILLRIPLMIERPQSPGSPLIKSSHWVLLFTDWGLINYLGAIGSGAASLGEAMAALLLALVAESWLTQQLRRANVDRWSHLRIALNSLASLGTPGLSSGDASRNDVSPPSQHALGGDDDSSEINAGSEHAMRSVADAASPPQSDTASSEGSLPVPGPASVTMLESDAEAAQWCGQLDDDTEPGCRVRLQQGEDDNQQRFVSGVLRVDFEPGQRHATIALAFPEPLRGTVEVELEPSHEEIQAEVMRTTETGFRAVVRRSSDQAPLRTEIEFFAAEAIGEGQPSGGESDGLGGSTGLP